ncbi:hypothetical protein RclHR1_08290003 [Rhizophagus clarus]|uniref:Uncharacterized protein n=1 Tax=Rhizophagus clarus TaxID=94130 RepID=A0A2Z6SN73_9GLOM|nr:hypothetical protein RclHR1_08290003 [Rhizophagus clarus]
MNPIYLIDQFFGSENLQPTPTNLANPELCTNAPYVTSTHSVSIHPSNQHYNMIQLSQPQQNEQTFQSNAVVNSVIVQDNSIVDQSNSVAFFFQPPDDFCNYHVKCWEVSFDLVIQLLNELNTNSSSINFNQNEYVFFYIQQSNNRIYQVVCELVSASSIMNKIIYSIEFEQNTGQEFTIIQKENLKFYLTNYLSRYLILN